MRGAHRRFVCVLSSVTLLAGCHSWTRERPPETLRTEESRRVQLILRQGPGSGGTEREVTLDSFEVRGDTIQGTFERFGSEQQRKFALAEVSAVRFRDAAKERTFAIVAGVSALAAVVLLFWTASQDGSFFGDSR